MSEELVSLDLETTGLSTGRDRIVEFGAVKQLVDGSRTRMSFLVNPTIPIPSYVQSIHGISNEMVKDCPTFRQVAPKILEFLGTTSTLCGHNLLRFDLPLLQAEFVRPVSNHSTSQSVQSLTRLSSFVRWNLTR